MVQIVWSLAAALLAVVVAGVGFWFRTLHQTAKSNGDLLTRIVDRIGHIEGQLEGIDKRLANLEG